MPTYEAMFLAWVTFSTKATLNKCPIFENGHVTTRVCGMSKEPNQRSPNLGKMGKIKSIPTASSATAANIAISGLFIAAPSARSLLREAKTGSAPNQIALHFHFRQFSLYARQLGLQFGQRLLVPADLLQFARLG